MFSNRYIFIYSSVMVIVVALVLATASNMLKPFQEKNIEVEKIRNILQSVNIESDFNSAQPLYKKYITKEIVVDEQGNEAEGEKAFSIDLAIENKKPVKERKLPIFIFNGDDGTKAYIVPVRGKGLWGPIWGYISFREDLNTIYGVMFDHKGETPGLGAEINTNSFQEQFFGKKILDENGKIVSIEVIKGGAAPENTHGVDAISGGTITSKGLEAMLKDCLLPYENYFRKIRNK